MAWSIVTREDVHEGADKAFVSIGHDHISFSNQFLRIAGTKANMRVTIHVDRQEYKVGFEFHEEERPNSYALISGRPVRCSAQSLIRKFAWIASVAALSHKHRRFVPRQENTGSGKLWVIQLCPAFEEKYARESKEIPFNARGIYRYRRENGEIIYIGRGDIRARLNSPDRKDWQFDTIEISLIEDPDKQVKWESFWIDRYKADNKGTLPFYNKVSGANHFPEPSIQNTSSESA